MVAVKLDNADIEKSLAFLEEFWAAAPSFCEKYHNLGTDEVVDFLWEDYTDAKMHIDPLLEAELTAEQKARLDKVLEVRDQYQDKLERLGRGE